MHTRSTTVASILALLVAACNMINSPLSDVPISNPSLLQIIAVANRDFSPAGYDASTLRVNLYDKHGEYVKVMDGHVTVNGRLMTDSDFGSYACNAEPVVPNTTYKFTVIMSDGSRDSCHVTAPADLHAFSVPSSYDRRAPLVISWANPDPSFPTTVQFKGDTTSVSFTAAPGQGSLTLQPASLSLLHPGQTLLVTALICRTGRLDSGFMSTSRVSATFTVARNMRI